MATKKTTIKGYDDAIDAIMRAPKKHAHDHSGVEAFRDQIKSSTIFDLTEFNDQTLLSMSNLSDGVLHESEGSEYFEMDEGAFNKTKDTFKIPYDNMTIFTWRASGYCTAINLQNEAHECGCEVLRVNHMNYGSQGRVVNRDMFQYERRIDACSGFCDHKISIDKKYGIDITQDRFDEIVETVGMERASWGCDSAFMISAAVMQLLSCKNISTPTVKHRNSVIASRRARKLPILTRKVLRFQLGGKANKQSGGTASNPATTRIHLCRGHFKRYTTDKPLFGKLTGLYWWQPHARGDKSLGVIEKNYKAVPEPTQ